jgi:hypothetical protein
MDAGAVAGGRADEGPAAIDAKRAEDTAGVPVVAAGRSAATGAVADRPGRASGGGA